METLRSLQYSDELTLFLLAHLASEILTRAINLSHLPKGLLLACNNAFGQHLPIDQARGFALVDRCHCVRSLGLVAISTWPEQIQRSFSGVFHELLENVSCICQQL